MDVGCAWHLRNDIVVKGRLKWVNNNNINNNNNNVGVLSSDIDKIPRHHQGTDIAWLMWQFSQPWLIF